MSRLEPTYPSNWVQIKLKDLVSKEKYSLRRGPFGGAIKKEIFVEDGYKVYEQKNAIYNDFELGHYYIDETKYKELESFAIKPGDFIISCSGTIGRVAIVPPYAQPGIMNQALLKITPNLEKISPPFFLRLLESPHIQMQMFGVTAGSAIKNVRPLEDIKLTEFMLPPLEEQKRIAAILDMADALRAKRRAALAKLDTLLQATFLHLFGDPITNPKGWETKNLSEVVKKQTIVTYGIVQAGPNIEEGGVPYIKTGDIKNSQIIEENLSKTSQEIASKFERSTVYENDLVMSIRATVGTIAKVPKSLNGANLTQGTAKISPGDKVLPDYLFWYIRSSGIQYWLQSQVKGATFREITLTKLRTMPVMIPPIQIQQKFVLIVENIQKQRIHMEIASKELDNLFYALQGRAFRGEL